MGCQGLRGASERSEQVECRSSNLLPPLDAWAAPRSMATPYAFCCGLNACFLHAKALRRARSWKILQPRREEDRRDQGTMAKPLMREGTQNRGRRLPLGGGSLRLSEVCVCVCVCVFVTPRRPRYISIYGCSPLNLCMCVSAAASLLFQASPSPSPLHVPLHPLIIHPLLHAAGPISSPQPPRD